LPSGPVSDAFWKRVEPLLPPPSRDPKKAYLLRKGSTLHLLVEGHGVPLSLVVTRDHRHDIPQLAAVLETIIVAQPLPSEEGPKKLSAAKDYGGKPAQESMVERHYLPRVIPKDRETHAKRLFPDIAPAAGCGKQVIPGSTVFGSSLSLMRKPLQARWLYLTQPRSSSAGKKLGLFTDKPLINPSTWVKIRAISKELWPSGPCHSSSTWQGDAG
jgi:hypothetical protein